METLIDALKTDKDFGQVLSFFEKKSSKASITELQSKVVLLLKKQILIEFYEKNIKEIDKLFNAEILRKNAEEFKDNPMDFVSGSILKIWTSKETFCGYENSYQKKILVMKILGCSDSEMFEVLKNIESLRKTRNMAGHDNLDKSLTESDDIGFFPINHPEFFKNLEKSLESFETLKKRLQKIADSYPKTGNI